MISEEFSNVNNLIVFTNVYISCVISIFFKRLFMALQKALIISSHRDRVFNISSSRQIIDGVV